jgi:hypothetical protein
MKTSLEATQLDTETLHGLQEAYLMPITWSG